MASVIEDRFPTAATGPKPTEDQLGDSRNLHDATVAVAEFLNAVAPEGRWKSLALTALEEALMWGNKAIFNSPRNLA